MNSPSIIPLVMTGIVAIVALAAIVYLVLVAEESPFQRFLGTYEARLESHTRFLLVPYSGAQIARLQLIVCSFLIAAALVFESLAAGGLAGLVAIIPPYLLSRQHAQRVALLDKQLDTWLMMLSNALKATPSIGDAIASTISLVPVPFSEEVDLVVKEMQLGTPVDRAVNNMSRRIDSPLVSGALATIVVARTTGGDLPEILERSASALREAARLEGVIRAKTAEGRGQVVVLAAIPFVICLAIGWMDPTWFSPMLAMTIGRTLLAGCFLVWLVALFWAYQIVNIDI